MISQNHNAQNYIHMPIKFKSYLLKMKLEHYNFKYYICSDTVTRGKTRLSYLQGRIKIEETTEITFLNVVPQKIKLEICKHLDTSSQQISSGKWGVSNQD